MADVLAKMQVVISAITADFNKKLNESESGLKKFAGNVTKLATTFGVAFGATEVANFALEVSKLTGEAEGVRNAFDRLPDSANLMRELQEATHGTVSELELMKRAVQAQNFNISLEQLPKLLEFATLRAQQTGQSVDYLVDSIVTGIGRKSPLILDNLGISAAKLSEEFKRTGDFSAAVGTIVDQELSKMPGFIDTAAIQAQQLQAALNDVKEAIGAIVNATGLFASGNGSVTDSLRGLTAFIREATPAIASYVKLLTIVPRTAASVVSSVASLFDDTLTSREVDEAIVKLNELRNQAKLEGNQQDVIKYTKAIAELSSKYALLKTKALEFKEVVTTGEPIRNIQFLRAELDRLQQEQLLQTGQELVNTNKKIEGINAEIKALQTLGIEKEKAAKKGAPEFATGSIGDLQKQISALNELKINATAITDIQLLNDQIAVLTNRIKELNEASKLTTIGSDLQNSIGANAEAAAARFEASMARIAADGKQMSSEVQGVVVDLSPLIANGITSIAEAFGSIGSGIGDFGRNILKAVADFGKQLGQLLVAQGTALLAAKVALKNPLTAIAAGAALIAISSALSNSISKAHSNTFGGGSAFASRSAGTSPSSQVETAAERGLQIILGGKFELENRKLVLALQRENIVSQRLGG